MAFKIQGEGVLQKRVKRQLASGSLGRGGSIVDDAEVLAKLNMLEKQNTVNKMLRPGIREAASAVRKKAKQLAPVESGLLKRSIASKNLTIAGKVIVAIVGPRTDRTEHVIRRFPDGRVIGVEANPAKYAHLVEFGTSGGGRGGPAARPPQPFMRPAWDGTNTKAIIARRTMHELRKAAQMRVGKKKADKAAVAGLRRAAR